MRWWIVETLIVAVTLAGAVWPNWARADDPAAVAQAKSLSRAFRSAAEKVKPTVVKIKTATKPRRVEGAFSCMKAIRAIAMQWFWATTAM